MTADLCKQRASLKYGKYTPYPLPNKNCCFDCIRRDWRHLSHSGTLRTLVVEGTTGLPPYQVEIEVKIRLKYALKTSSTAQLVGIPHSRTVSLVTSRTITLPLGLSLRFHEYRSLVR